MHDLLLAGGTVIDPVQKYNGIASVAISGDKIVAVGHDLGPAKTVIDCTGKLVTAGLVDFHGHFYWGATDIGIAPDESSLRHGVTTVVDAGSSGSSNFAGFKRWIVDASRTRMYCFVHLSTLGLTGLHIAGELSNNAHADPDGATKIIRENPGLVIGLKIRTMHAAVAGPTMPTLQMARGVADETGCRLMVHIGNSIETLPILDLMREGDIATHMANGRPNNLLDPNGIVLPEVLEARARGVLFDVGQGRMGFSLDVAQRLLDQGFLPDTISTDFSSHFAASPTRDLLTVMTRYVTMGLPLEEAIRLTTARPAEILGGTGVFGSLNPGGDADVAVLDWDENEYRFSDLFGVEMTAPRRLIPHLTIRSGQLVPAPVDTLA